MAIKKHAEDVNWYCECGVKLVHEHEDCPTCGPQVKDNERDRLRASSPDDIRNLGWLVAIHNDYILEGRRMTFWLFTDYRTGRFIKGEGFTDVEALNVCRHQILPLILPSDRDRIKKIMEASCG